jgi:hypothetical protein
LLPSVCCSLAAGLMVVILIRPVAGSHSTVSIPSPNDLTAETARRMSLFFIFNGLFAMARHSNFNN